MTTDKTKTVNSVLTLRLLICWNCRFESRQEHGCISVLSVVCCQIDLCGGPIPGQEGSYRLWCVTMCGLETPKMRRPWPALGCYARQKNKTAYHEIIFPEKTNWSFTVNNYFAALVEFLDFKMTFIQWKVPCTGINQVSPTRCNQCSAMNLLSAYWTPPAFTLNLKTQLP